MPGAALATRLGILAAYAKARSRHFTDRDAFEHWQARQLRAALRRARRRFPYYTDVPAPRLEHFPVVDKTVVIEHFAEFNDRGLALADCLAAARAAEAHRDFTANVAGVSIGLSSGTSGGQSVFLTSPAERRWWAGAIMAKALPDGLLGGARTALVLRAGGPLYESVEGGRVAFRFFDLATPLDAQRDSFVEFAPTILAAPPSALVRLAAARVAGNLPIAPERIFSIAEVLDPHDRAAIEAAFEARVDQIYQATEGFLGISCPAGRLHLNEDLVHVELEPVGPDRWVPIVTDLNRRTQAVVRLRLDDVLVGVEVGCPCGSVLRVVEQVEGRCDDVLLLPDAEGRQHSVFADFVRGAVLSAAEVADFRVVQEGPDLVRLAVRPERAWPAAAAELRTLFTATGLVLPQIEVGEFEDGPAAAKLRRVRRLPGCG